MKYSLLNVNENENQILFSANVTKDLSLNVLFDEQTIGVLSKAISDASFDARREMFQALDNVDVLKSLEELYDLVSVFSRNQELLNMANCECARLISFSSYARAFFDVSEWKCSNDAFFIKRLRNVLSEVVFDTEMFCKYISEYEKLCEKISCVSITIGGGSSQVTGYDNGQSLYDSLLKCAADIGCENKEVKRATKISDMSVYVSNAIIRLFPNEISRMRELKKIISAFIDEDVIVIKEQLQFYFKLHSIRNRAAEKEIPYCYPEKSKTSKFIAGSAYDISLINTADKIISNDINIDEEKAFFILGANGGGKTTYLRTVGINLILALSGCFIFAEDASVYLYKRIYTMYPISEIVDHGGRFCEELNRLEKTMPELDEDSFVIINEYFSSAPSDKGTSYALESMRKIKEMNASCLFVSHFYDVAESEIPCLYAIVSTNDDNKRTFKIQSDATYKNSYANDILKKYNLDEKSLERLSEQCE